MSDSTPAEDLLLIRCPSCGQRFNVADDLRDRMVECGECDEQFEITDEVIVRGKKFYPGERKDPLLDHLHRVDQAIPQVNNPAAAQSYASQGQGTPNLVNPISPLHVLLGLFGVFAMAITALVLVLGAARGGVLDGVTTDKRLVIAIFAAVLGFVLLVYANPRNRIMSIVLGLLMAGGLVALPFKFTEGSKLLGGADSDEYVYADAGSEVMATRQVREDDLRELIGSGPLEAEILRYENQGSSLTAHGLWLRNLKVRNCLLVRDYIIRETGADLQSHFYPRGNGDYLMVVSGVDESLEQLAIIAAALGKVENVFSNLGVVEVRIDNEQFHSGPIDKLTDASDPDFYLLNKVELESIDLDRVSAAVKRLAEAEPKLFRRDITTKLIALLGNDWVDFKQQICRTLLVWAEVPGPAGEEALKQIKHRMERDLTVPQEMAALAVKEKTPGIIPVVYDLWLINPTVWESWYGKLGPEAEKYMLQGFEGTTGTFRQSAIRILGVIGGEDSLSILEEAAKYETDAETKILCRNAIRAIKVNIATR